MADYGELDSSLDDLRYEWAQIDLESRTAGSYSQRMSSWPAMRLVVKDNAGFSFDFYTDPAYDGEALQGYLLARCEARARAQMADGEESGAVAKALLPQAIRPAGRRLKGRDLRQGNIIFRCRSCQTACHLRLAGG